MTLRQDTTDSLTVININQINMEYKLAEKLKNAGFPQPQDALAKNSARVICKGEDCAYSPTLEELIEACGDCLSHIKKWGGYWWAVSHCGHLEHEIFGNNLEEQAVDIEEALANLWIKLNN